MIQLGATDGTVLLDDNSLGIGTADVAQRWASTAGYRLMADHSEPQ